MNVVGEREEMDVCLQTSVGMGRLRESRSGGALDGRRHSMPSGPSRVTNNTNNRDDGDTTTGICVITVLFVTKIHE